METITLIGIIVVDVLGILLGDCLVGMKHDAAFAAQPLISSSQQENKVVL